MEDPSPTATNVIMDEDVLVMDEDVIVIGECR